MRPSCLFVFLAASAVAQIPAPPAFDVASVKINPQFNPNNRSTALASETIHPGSVAQHNFTLTMLVAWAYDLQRPQVAAPDWAESVRYDVDGKCAGPVKEAEMRRMLQNLLVQRFGLRTHRETRTMDAFVLVTGKDGPKMTRSKREGPAESHQDEARGMVVEGVSIGQIAEEFSHDLAAPVVDQTGLSGLFDLTLNVGKYVDDLRAKVRSMPPPVNEEELRVILAQNILQGELGLRLGQRRMPIEVLVIDQAEKTPREN